MHGFPFCNLETRALRSLLEKQKDRTYFPCLLLHTFHSTKTRQMSVKTSSFLLICFWLSLLPLFTSAAVDESSSSGSCVNVAGWSDRNGLSCSDYESNSSMCESVSAIKSFNADYNAVSFWREVIWNEAYCLIGRPIIYMSTILYPHSVSLCENIYHDVCNVCSPAWLLRIYIIHVYSFLLHV